MEQRNSKDDENKEEPKRANEILDHYSLIAAPIMFIIVTLIYFFASFKFDSPDPDVVNQANEKFKTMCSNSW